jgi:hypothetical protein
MLWFLSSSIRYLTSNDEEEDEENGPGNIKKSKLVLREN